MPKFIVVKLIKTAGVDKIKTYQKPEGVKI